MTVFLTFALLNFLIAQIYEFSPITVWCFCGVAINIEVEKKTLASPQEMLVIPKYIGYLTFFSSS